MFHQLSAFPVPCSSRIPREWGMSALGEQLHSEINLLFPAKVQLWGKGMLWGLLRGLELGNQFPARSRNGRAGSRGNTAGFSPLQRKSLSGIPSPLSPEPLSHRGVAVPPVRGGFPRAPGIPAASPGADCWGQHSQHFIGSGAAFLLLPPQGGWSRSSEPQ